ncbi:MAG: F0F1 ATP synthase subunit A [Gammaproteobacteria bacterium]|nr:F0F1 ATP synthase subunit A [Gammaproteobacteria bacterium]
MHLSPDDVVVWTAGAVRLTLTVVTTWGVMALLAAAAWLLGRRLAASTGLDPVQNALEILVGGLRDQIAAVGLRDAERYLPFVGTLFVYIASANLLTIVPGYEAPTASLSTTAALATCVFVAVPFYGIRARGLRGYLATYLEPSVFMLPFNLVGELSRTLALAVRLFGNAMSGGLVAAIVLALAPLFFPVLFKALELLTGLVQAYIFSVLACVYIAAATHDADTPPPVTD